MGRRKKAEAHQEPKNDAEYEPESERELLEAILRKAGEKILSGREDFSVADLIRLLEARRDVQEESVKEVEVRWVDDSGEECGGKK